jgi:uncharacterized protein (TIGR04255 family)
MTCRVPIRLKKEPLIEAIWQVQFETAPQQAVGDALPGILFGALRGQQPDLKIRRLPVADIPAPVAALDPNLRFSAKYRIESTGWPFLFQVGDRVITMNCRRPYVRWASFREKVLELAAILESSGLIPAPKRHSLRYIDLLALEQFPGLAGLRVSLNVGVHEIERHPLQLRVELPDENCIHVLQVAAAARVTLPDGEKEGTLIDLETFADLSDDGWESVRHGLDSLHTASKAMFFCQVLNDQAIEALEPEYEEEAP